MLALQRFDQVDDCVCQRSPKITFSNTRLNFKGHSTPRERQYHVFSPLFSQMQHGLMKQQLITYLFCIWVGFHVEEQPSLEGVFNLRALISVMAAVVPDYPASCLPEIIPDVSFHFLRESRVENSDSVENDFKRLKISNQMNRNITQS